MAFISLDSVKYGVRDIRDCRCPRWLCRFLKAGQIPDLTGPNLPVAGDVAAISVSNHGANNPGKAAP
jgi:hypothetical protein